LARLIRERPVFVNLGGGFVCRPAGIGQTALSGDFCGQNRIGIMDFRRPLKSAVPELWIRGTMPQPESLKRRILTRI
jgi:hypothetical protein